MQVLHQGYLEDRKKIVRETKLSKNTEVLHSFGKWPRLHKLKIYVSILLLIIKINQSTCEMYFSYFLKKRLSDKRGTPHIWRKISHSESCIYETHVSVTVCLSGMVRFEFAHETKWLLCLKTVPWDYFFFFWGGGGTNCRLVSRATS